MELILRHICVEEMCIHTYMYMKKSILTPSHGSTPLRQQHNNGNMIRATP
jgi:hypothetical protein